MFFDLLDRLIPGILFLCSGAGLTSTLCHGDLSKRDSEHKSVCPVDRRVSGIPNTVLTGIDPNVTREEGLFASLTASFQELLTSQFKILPKLDPEVQRICGKEIFA